MQNDERHLNRSENKKVHKMGLRNQIRKMGGHFNSSERSEL